MKTISKLVFSAVAAFATMGFSTACYAVVELVDLPCCTGASGPTRYVSEGIPDVQQSARVFDIIKIHGTTVPHEGMPGYDEWKKGIVSSVKARTMPKEQGLELLGASRPTIYAMCVGSFNSINISKVGSSITCPVGMGIGFEQSFPTCADPQTGPCTVLEITKVSREDAERQIREAEERIAARNARIKEIDEQMARNTQDIREAGQHLVESGYVGRLQQATSSVFGSSSSFL